MSGLGDLVSNLGMNSKGFTKGIGQAKSGLGSFASSATSLLNPITAGLAAMTAAAASAGLSIYGIAGRISTLAGIADKAIQTGLSGKFLQQLGYAADQSGVSAETLTGGIKKLTIAIGKADPKPFAELGITFADLKSLSPEQQFLKVAEAIGKLPTAAERAAAAVKIFGKSGIEMTGLFAGGLNDINKLLKDAEALGIGLSDEALAKAARADDAIQRMKSSFGALISQVAIGLSYAFETVATKIADLIPPVTKFLDKINAMPEPIKFAGEVIVATFDVAFEFIKAHWQTMLDDMMAATVSFAKNSIPILGPLTAKDLQGLLNPVAGVDKNLRQLGAGRGGAMPGGGGQGGLPAAQARLDAIIGQFNQQRGGPAGAGKGVDPNAGAKAMGDWLLGMLPKAKDLAARAGMLGGGMFDEFRGIGTGTKTAVAMKQSSPEFAGAFKKGSAEAFSAVLRSSTKSPEVAATDKLTTVAKQQLAATNLIVKNTTPQFAPEFA